jgi:Ran GTPase-activating protein (RanGAP) involved in mRNA processing and transport
MPTSPRSKPMPKSYLDKKIALFETLNREKIPELINYYEEHKDELPREEEERIEETEIERGEKKTGKTRRKTVRERARKNGSQTSMETIRD